MENKHTEQLLKSGGHSASLDETDKYRGQCGQPNNHQVVTKVVTLGKLFYLFIYLLIFFIYSYIYLLTLIY